MARGRMIAASLGESRKFAALPDGDTRMLYMLLVANADKAGRVEADPLYITRKILTRLPYGEEFVKHALDEMHAVGLIELYDADGIPCLEITKFEEHNTPHHKEADSKLPSSTSSKSQARAKLDASTLQARREASRMVGENKREKKGSEQKGEPPTGVPPNAGAREETGGRPDGAPPSNEDPPELAERLANLPEGTHAYIRKSYWRNQNKSDAAKKLEAFTLKLQRGEA